MSNITKPIILDETGARIAEALETMAGGGSSAKAESIASPYAPTETYNVGEKCTYNGKYYKCIVQIATAEEWDVTHWEETTVEEQLNTVKSDLQALGEETKDLSNSLIESIKGFDYLHAEITENKYANYTYKIISNLSGSKVAEFDVSHVVKFDYLFTMDTPDARGLFFKDKNGNALTTAYQAIAKEQEITVPDGAVKCYATVNSMNDIVVFEIVAGDRPEEILRSQATYTSRTSGGITYEWQNSNTKLYIHGKRTGVSIDTLYDQSSSFPSGLEPGKQYRFVIKTQSEAINLCLLPYINGSEGTLKRIFTEEVFTIPETWTGIAIRIMVFGENVEVDETIDCPEIYTIPEAIGLEDRVSALENAAYTDNKTNPLAYIRRDAGFLSLFHTVGCIGDSLASGECAYKTGGTTHYVDLYPFSWGQCLARLTGNTYYNFSQGGLSSRTWLTSQHCTDCFDGNHDCDMYFIGLGQNDKNNSIPVGTTADINLSDYTQNADTYCGNMGQIIQRLQILQPKAPIFVFIDPNTPMGDQAYNNVIPDIVDLFDNVWIIDLKTYAKKLFTESTEIIGSQYRGGHYSALGYQQIAFVIATYVDWIIRNNLSDFSQVEFIGTNYEW